MLLGTSYSYTSPIRFSSFFSPLFTKLSQHQKHIQIRFVIQKKKKNSLTLSGWVEGEKGNFLSVFCISAAGFIAAMATDHMMRCIRLLCVEHKGKNEHSVLLKLKVALEFLLWKCVRSNTVALSICSTLGEELGACWCISLQNQVRHNRIYETDLFCCRSITCWVEFHGRPHPQPSMGTGQIFPVPLSPSPAPSPPTSPLINLKV